MEPKKTYKSYRYKAKTTWGTARRGTLSAAGKPNVVVGSPPEFKGEPDIWAPEELLVGSLNTCLMLTFLALAQARGLTPVGYESEAEGLLENVEGTYRITEVTVRPLRRRQGPNLPARPWRAPRLTASSLIPLMQRSSSPRSLSLHPGKVRDSPGRR